MKKAINYLEKAEISTWERYDAGQNVYVKLTE